jgi:DNA modification methylase
MRHGALPGLDPTRSLGGNELLYGDNLTLMRDMPSGSVDLIYLDPPFNSQRTYNLLYRQLTGAPVPEQEEAFCDAWEMDAEKEEMLRRTPEFLASHDVSPEIAAFWQVWMNALKGTQPRLLAYLLYMSWRLVEMRRILKPTGSLYLHCDPTASHYIKIILDSIFGHKNFQNEIAWKRTFGHGDSRTWSRVTDCILFYTAGQHFTWNVPHEKHSEEYIKSHYNNIDINGRAYQLTSILSPSPRPNMMYEWKGFPSPPSGWRFSREKMADLDRVGLIWYPRHKDGSLDTSKRPRFIRYLDEQKGPVITSIWADIPPLNARSKDRLGYPTQKPVPLLKRIIEASSNPGDIVFDPFAGCGTSMYAAHETGRRWVGCDIAILSIRIVRDVLLQRYGLREGLEYHVRGVPLSIEGAEELFRADTKQFQHWAVELSGGFVNSRFSGDRGVDGRLWFETTSGLRAMTLSVKGGKTNPSHVRDLGHAAQTEPNSVLGGFICLQAPTKGMNEAAASAGMYRYQGVDYPRLQIRSIADLLAGKSFDTPTRVRTLSWQRQGELPLAPKGQPSARDRVNGAMAAR